MSKRHRGSQQQSGFKPVKLVARSEGQKGLIRCIHQNEITICSGSPGSGKTHIAAGLAVKALKGGYVSRVVLCRPIIGSGEDLGFLPGDMEEKMGPWLRPLFDELGKFMEVSKRKELLANEVIEVAPLYMMRGRTFNDAFVICDEAQNASASQLKMLLTRLGQNAKMVLVGDILQSDLVGQNAFGQLFYQLGGVPEIGLVRLGPKDVVRNALINDIEERLCTPQDYQNLSSAATSTSESPGDRLGTLPTNAPTRD